MISESIKEEVKKPKEAQDKVKVAKKIVKDMEKWAKQLNQKKDYIPAAPANLNVQTQSTPAQSRTSDTAFSIVKQLSSDYSVTTEKKERTMELSYLPSLPTEKLLTTYDSDSDEANIPASGVYEKDYVDFEKLTCNLCKRIFSSSEILSKHLKMSSLHKENLNKYKLQQGLVESSLQE